MDKPVSLSVKDWLIRNMSVEMNTSEKVICAVIDHEFSSAREALATCNSIEFSGFGKFYFNIKKAHKKAARQQEMKQNIEKLINNPDTSPQKRASLHYKLEKLMSDMKILQTKIGESNEKD